MLNRLRRWRQRRRNRCHFTTEFDGLFISRMHCSTHDFRTDSLTEVQQHIKEQIMKEYEDADRQE